MSKLADTDKKREYIKSLVKENTQIRFVNVAEDRMYIDGYIDFDTMREICRYLDCGGYTLEERIFELGRKINRDLLEQRAQLFEEEKRLHEEWRQLG